MTIVTGSGHGAQRSADMRLGTAIRVLRREQGLTLVQLAAATELSQPFLSQLELGRSRPSMRSLYRIAEALGTTQQALLGLAEPASTVPLAGDGSAGGRLLLHDSGGADITEFADIPAEFSDFYAHARRELLYVAQGRIELEVRDGENDTFTTLGPRDSTGYSGQLPHRFRRVGAGPCVVVMVHSGT
ncbi:MAG TPA: XRE family transcriptional regulator [Pseudonocardia sp.]